MHDINRMSRGGMPWPKTGATQYHAQLGLPDKDRAIKVLVVFNDLALGSRVFGPAKHKLNINN